MFTSVLNNDEVSQASLRSGLKYAAGIFLINAATTHVREHRADQQEDRHSTENPVDFQNETSCVDSRT